MAWIILAWQTVNELFPGNPKNTFHQTKQRRNEKYVIVVTDITQGGESILVGDWFLVSVFLQLRIVLCEF